MDNIKTKRRSKIRMRIRKRVQGTSDRPRLSVYRSNTTTYAQLINDEKGWTVVSSSSKKIATQTGTPIEKARMVGEEIAKKAIEKNIEQIVFDRSGYKYHGRVQAVAEGARAQKLKF